MPISKKSAFLLVLLVGVVGVIIKFILDPFGKDGRMGVPKTETPSKKESAIPSPQAPAAFPTSQVKQVTANTSYGSPAGPEEVGFTLGLDANEVIVSADTTVKAADQASTSFQESFKANLSSVVVGKKLSDLSSIDKVGKASLTTNAFNQALAQMKSQL